MKKARYHILKKRTEGSFLFALAFSFVLTLGLMPFKPKSVLADIRAGLALDTDAQRQDAPSGYKMPVHSDTYQIKKSEKEQKTDNIQWDYSGGVLTISGTGKMQDKADSDWDSLKDDITELVVKPGVTHIGVQAFMELPHLKKVTLPDTLVSIGEAAFYGCYSLKSIVIPSGVKTLESGVFAECDSLDYIEMPGVEKIEEYALQETSISELTISAGLTQISPLAFYKADITGIYVDAGNPVYCAEGGVLYSKDKSKLFCYPAQKTGDSFMIPSTVKTIGEAAFANARELEQVVIPDTVNTLEASAFQESGLTQVQISDGITNVDDFVFFSCENLASVQFGKGLKKTSYQMFRECRSLTTIDFGYTLSELDAHTFAYCESLKEVEIPSNIVKIGAGCFGECYKLECVTTKALKFIPYSSFWNCHALKEVVLNEGVEAIYREAFYDCESLKTVTLPESVTFVDENGFPRATSLICKNAGLQKYGYNGYRYLERIIVSGKEDYDNAFAVLKIVNQERQKEGLSSLVMDQGLLDAAMKRAAEISVCFSHTRPDGATCFSIADGILGENIAAGQRTAKEAMKEWMNSEGHRENILTKEFTTIGVGCYKSNGTYYWVQCFGNDVGQTVDAALLNRTVKSTINLATEKFEDAVVDTDVSFGFDDDKEYVYNFEIAIGRTNIKVGGATKAKLYLENAGMAGKTVRIEPECFIWKSKRANVASVDTNGKITGIAKGKTKITAQMQHYSASLNVKVGK